MPTLVGDDPLLFYAIFTLFSGQFIGNHYQATIDAVHTLEAKLDVLQRKLGLTRDDFYNYLEAERKYLDELKSLALLVLRKIQYVEALINLGKCQYVQDLPILSRVS